MQGDKELGFWISTALVVGNIIGMGIFMLPASLAPYGYTALAGWGITVAGMAVLARVFARLAREFPRADGPYVYIRENVGEAPAFLAIWCYWVSLWVTNAALAIGVVGYLTAAVPALQSVPAVVLALAMIWLFVGICLLGARMGGGVQVLTTALKLVPMLAIIVLGVWVLLTQPGAYTRDPPTSLWTLKDLMAASTIALYAMLGIESATVPAGRVKDPERTIPRATLAGTFLTAAIYVAVSAIAISLLPQAQLAQSNAPFVDLLNRYVGAGIGQWLAVFVVVSGLGCLNGWTLLTGELTCSMATHGVMPRSLGRLNAHGAPAVALVVTAVLASAMVLMNYSKSLVEGFTFLTLVVTAANLPLYFFAAVALAVYWRKGGRTASTDMLVLGVIGTLYSVFAFIGIGQEPFLWSLVLAAAGVPLYLWLKRRAH
ncbi:MAG TPA: amino acid permease [Steroidobacteraceae bacterium]